MSDLRLAARTLSLLVATAAFAAPALAQSSVTLSGLIDVSAGTLRAPGQTEDNRVIKSGQMTTSWLGVQVKEDLGSGWAASAKVESFLRADSGDAGRFTGDGFWARNAWVGIGSSSLGTLTLGRQTTPYFVQTLKFNAFGDSFGFSPSIRHHFNAGPAPTLGALTGDSAWSESLQYASPTWSGASFTLIAGEGTPTSNGGNWGAAASYASGGLSLGLVHQSVKRDKATGPDTDTTATQLAASYDFGRVKLFGQASEVKAVSPAGAHNRYRIYGVGASMAVTAQGKLLAQAGRLTAETGPARTTVSVGWDHFISKRTDLYAVAMSDRLAGLSGGHALGVGVRHRF